MLAPLKYWPLGGVVKNLNWLCHNPEAFSLYWKATEPVRLKDVIETNPSSSVDNIDVIKYTLKSHPSLIRYGYSAQQVQSILPDVVTINSPISGSIDEGTLMLNYNDLHVLKIAALERKVSQLEADVAALKS